VRKFEQERDQWLYSAATTSRFFIDDLSADQETAYLVWPNIQEGFAALEQGDAQQASSIARRVASSFPRLHRRFPELTLLASGSNLPLARRALDRLKHYLAGLNSEILPAAWRGTVVHSIARRMKYALLRYKPR
jgi:hypothetical protein